jgi:hypothetical protein
VSSSNINALNEVELTTFLYDVNGDTPILNFGYVSMSLYGF